MTVVMSYFPYPIYPFSYLFPLLVLLPGGKDVQGKHFLYPDPTLPYASHTLTLPYTSVCNGNLKHNVHVHLVLGSKVYKYTLFSRVKGTKCTKLLSFFTR